MKYRALRQMEVGTEPPGLSLGVAIPVSIGPGGQVGMWQQGEEWGKCLGTISLRYTPEIPLCSLPVLSFIHVVPGQVLERLIKQDDRQRYLEDHHPLVPAQWGHLENKG